MKFEMLYFAARKIYLIHVARIISGGEICRCHLIKATGDDFYLGQIGKCQ